MWMSVGVCTELIVLSAWACVKTEQTPFKLWFRGTELHYYLKPKRTLCYSHTLITSYQSTGQTFQRGCPTNMCFSPSPHLFLSSLSLCFLVTGIREKTDLQRHFCALNDLNCNKTPAVWLNLAVSVTESIGSTAGLSDKTLCVQKVNLSEMQEEKKKQISNSTVGF